MLFLIADLKYVEIFAVMTSDYPDLFFANIDSSNADDLGSIDTLVSDFY